MATIKELKDQTAQYAVEHITGKGMHTGINWLRDSFNEYCQAVGANEYNPDDINFELDDLVENLKKAPWVTDAAEWYAVGLETKEDIDRVVNDFICEHWLMQPEEVTTKHVDDVLKVAPPSPTVTYWPKRWPSTASMLLTRSSCSSSIRCWRI